MEPSGIPIASSKLIKDFVLIGRQLNVLHDARMNMCATLRKECLHILNEIFDELRTVSREKVIQHAEWSILDIDEHNEKIIIMVRFATKKNDFSIPEDVKHELITLYRSITTEAEKRFLARDSAFIIQTIFA